MDQRANRMKTLIINTFFDCLETLDFTQITIGKISDQAMINRSTFYRYFSDKYILRDTIVADIVKDFADHMEVDFLHMDIKNKDHTKTLEYSLSHLCTKKRELELLWNQPTLGRNVFDEMIDAGASKVENEIKNHSDTVSASQITEMMERHMISGTVSTLLS